MTVAAVALSEDGKVVVVPKHAVSAARGLTLCGRDGTALLGMRWEWVPAVDQCPECVLFLSAEQ